LGGEVNYLLFISFEYHYLVGGIFVVNHSFQIQIFLCPERFIEIIEINKKMKYIVVTGGVVSGLGKGITISSIGYSFYLSIN